MRSPALVAAHQAADAVAALLLHADEGHFGDVEVVEKLAEALSLAIELQRSQVEECDLPYRAALALLQHVLTTHVEGWAG